MDLPGQISIYLEQQLAAKMLKMGGFRGLLAGGREGKMETNVRLKRLGIRHLGHGIILLCPSQKLQTLVGKNASVFSSQRLD